MALGRDDTARVVRASLSTQHLTVEDREAAEIALNAVKHGLDSANVLHLARSGSASVMPTTVPMKPVVGSNQTRWRGRA